ncbi:hypothetical protein TNCT_446521 [Trichonephila clavata]|uniref:Uncharacterized protein n=1 Tax=Trichonephila clavata TaxID=2740835 RepID=A0A8X6GDM5_TRICU|nr:hypothetical protein TNCT_446521 [Trichonephila clavata]
MVERGQHRDDDKASPVSGVAEGAELQDVEKPKLTSPRPPDPPPTERKCGGKDLGPGNKLSKDQDRRSKPQGVIGV